MSAVGSIGWFDLTVPDADSLRDFYAAVTGWTPSPVAMGGYSDYCMSPPGSESPVAGVCHARGVNANIPPVWLAYVTVADVDASSVKCVELGGTILHGPIAMGGMGRFCIIRDPAGAVIALFTPAA